MRGDKGGLPPDGDFYLGFAYARGGALAEEGCVGDPGGGGAGGVLDEDEGLGVRGAEVGAGYVDVEVAAGEGGGGGDGGDEGGLWVWMGVCQ